MKHIDKIRERAHQIWEADGRPEGREADHWQQAQDQLRNEGQMDEFGIPDELPDLTSSDPTSLADGHVIEPGAGGTSDMPDEAQQANVDPVSGPGGQPG